MEKVFLSVLNMSLTASFVIAVIMLARLPLKKAPKIISYALWAVAGFRLVFPFTLESVFSLLPFKASPIPQDISMQAVPRINSGITVIDNAVSASLPAAVPYASINPMQVILAIGSAIWIFGIAVMLIYSFVSIILLKRRLRGAILVEGNLCKADNLKTPFAIGLFRPRIYIPAGLSDEECRYIVLHEQTHIRRHDHIVKMFAYFILCLHWFNPLAWIAFVLMSADMEMSCDERVMKELGGEIKNAYSLSLVRAAAGRKILNGSPLAFGRAV
ncbi:MAG: M56 family metallopeptidase [Clostridiales bacterium]|jgi:beta-lactamase regulating signal transducer with metallopeptidase domain|nr:M56 family metallopeptidase [Clostridiales bacterium]